MSFIDEFESFDDKSNIPPKKDINFKILLGALAVISFALYLASLLFGTKSYETLFNLQEQNEVLDKNIKNLEKDNFQKQKKYFEYKELGVDE